MLLDVCDLFFPILEIFVKLTSSSFKTMWHFISPPTPHLPLADTHIYTLKWLISYWWSMSHNTFGRYSRSLSYKRRA